MISLVFRCGPPVQHKVGRLRRRSKGLVDEILFFGVKSPWESLRKRAFARRVRVVDASGRAVVLSGAVCDTAEHFGRLLFLCKRREC